MAISGRAMLAVMGMSEGKLGEKNQQLYYDLAFFLTASGRGWPSDELRELFRELDAFANPNQTGEKINWSQLGWIYSGKETSIYEDYRQILGEPPKDRWKAGSRIGSPEWVKEKVDDLGDQVRARLKPILDKFGLKWPGQEKREGVHRY